MPRRERLGRVRMDRVALVAPKDALRALLVEVADEGTVDLDATTESSVDAGSPTAHPRLRRDPPDPETATELDVALRTGEAELARQAGNAVTHGRVAALLGWMPEAAIAELRARIAPIGGAVVVLARPPGVEPPTLLAPRGAAAPFRVLIDTYGTVRYADVDPTPFAAAAFAVMFGMMFGDVGQGLVLVLLGLIARTGRGMLGRFHDGWALAVAAGAAATVFGFAYGEFFGPTHVVPAAWIVPLDEPVTLLVAGVVVGALLIAISYVIATVNRWREGGFTLALYDSSAIAGLCTYVALALIGAGLYEDISAMTVTGALLLAVGITLVFVGHSVAARGAAGGGTAQAVVETIDGVLRLGSNLVSFARLAAFGLMHAAILSVVWEGTTALWHVSPTALGSIVLFIAGNAVAFALEVLVVGVQALRLEYYELFSRIFGEEGRPFRPWHVPLLVDDDVKEVSWPSGGSHSQSRSLARS